nr:FxsB family cyclophane-forming radical SAM/SPASM peptide maturase [Streptacidiphilus sp. P02-A3a]
MLQLDVPGLRRAGRAPTPFRQFVLKTSSRCNLACDYCYLYEGPDQTWRSRPVQLPSRTALHTAARIGEHVRTHRLGAIRVDLHGGEPLLLGPGPLIGLAQAVREALPPWCTAQVSVQTNGTLLTERVLDRLAGAGIGVGLSLDGGTAALNRHRTDHAGRSSWPAVLRAARLLAGRPGSYAGILTTIDVESDPVEVYRSLAALAPPVLDLLLPHANWSAPPSGPAGRHGDWLIRVFDQWWADPGPGPPIRLFHEIIGLLLGRPGTNEAVGLSPVAAVVVDTNGAIEQVDAIRSAYHGAGGTGLDVFHHPFDAALDHPGVVARQLGRDALARECLECPLVTVCGGGNYVHRFRHGEGFRNPSVYCTDLEPLIRHIAGALSEVAGQPAGFRTDVPDSPVAQCF